MQVVEVLDGDMEEEVIATVHHPPSLPTI
jgi:hypothetical protein